MTDYLLLLLIWLDLYILYGLSLNFLVGYTGLLSLCNAAFTGVGGYVVALAAARLELGFCLSLLLAVLAGILMSYLVSIPAARLRHDFFVLASLGFQSIILVVLNNWRSLTNGPYGISGIARPVLFGHSFKTPLEMALLLSSIAVLVILFSYYIAHSPFGRLMKAVREDERAAQSLGKNTAGIKRVAFALSAGIAAAAGGLYATYVSYIDPGSFDLWQSVFMLSIVIIGGAGNIRGPLMGALVVLLIPELLKWIHFPDSAAANTRQILFGLLILGLMRWRPQGILGDYRFS